MDDGGRYTVRHLRLHSAQLFSPELTIGCVHGISSTTTTPSSSSSSNSGGRVTTSTRKETRKQNITVRRNIHVSLSTELFMICPY